MNDSAQPAKLMDEITRKGHAFRGRALDFGQRQVNGALSRISSALPEGPVGGLCAVSARLAFSPEEILLNYAQGMFPMDKRGAIQWHHPDPRSVLPLDQLHVPSRIKTYLRKGAFELCFDRDCAGVLSACSDRKETWLTARVREAYLGLFEMGAVHSVEAWDRGRLVGGMFGVALGRIYTVESMFSHENHASKLAFAFAAQQLGAAGYQLIDCQFQQDHFQRFGAVEIAREEYRKTLAAGLIHPATFPSSESAPQRARDQPAAKATPPQARRKGKKRSTEAARPRPETTASAGSVAPPPTET